MKVRKQQMLARFGRIFAVVAFFAFVFIVDRSTKSESPIHHSSSSPQREVARQKTHDNENIIRERLKSDFNAPKTNKERHRKKQDENDEMQPLVNGAVDLVDSLVNTHGSEYIVENYNVVKSMLMLWNPEASQWARKVSVEYKAAVETRTERARRKGDPIPPMQLLKDVPIEQCGCKRSINATEVDFDLETTVNSSTCSRHSVFRGRNQRVIGFSFYGNPNSTLGKSRKYFEGIRDNLNLVPEFYPGWTIRVYYDLHDDDPLMGDLCSLACKNPKIDLCYVRNLPTAGDVHKIFAMNWRFLPILDPQVSHYVSRDLDSRLNPRETAAVKEWLEDSDKAFHVMRDHPAHSIEMLGSAWGLRMTDLERPYVEQAFRMGAKDKIFWAPRDAYGPDQGFLKRYLWPWGKWNALSHDAYTCLQFSRTSPFPTRRIEGEKYNFVASVIGSNDVMRQECPEKCRPKDHKDWTLC